MPVTINAPAKDSLAEVLVTDNGRTFVAASGMIDSAGIARQLYAVISQDLSTVQQEAPPAGAMSTIVFPGMTSWNFGVGDFLPDACCGSAPHFGHNYIGVWVVPVGDNTFESVYHGFFGRCQKD